MTDSTITKDLYYMSRALTLANNGRYTTAPNPRVGCILVRNQQIIAESWHVRAGESHAEILALAQIDYQGEGVTAYVTLEPCSHYGRTPPCCDALIKAKIARVVVAMQDPNPQVSGQGLARLRAAGIPVICGVLEPDAQALNRGFIQRMTQKKPLVRSKLAMSLDGRTAMANGESQWISSTQSRADVQWLRAESSAIMTGINTVLADNPSLTVRLTIDVSPPVRVILDSQLRMPTTAKMLKLKGETWILTTANNAEKKRALENAGAKVFILPSVENRLDLKAVFEFLAKQQINDVLVEAGASLNGALLADNLVDEWLIYLAPCVLGDQGRGLFHLPALQQLSDKKKLNFQQIRRVGIDLKLTLIK
jgi:diaminohydroxyphosphoribosylaminopyrimidine deaminase/5-amino-6-(5-phosphoribosylamino)uracil reductase